MLNRRLGLAALNLMLVTQAWAIDPADLAPVPQRQAGFVGREVDAGAANPIGGGVNMNRDNRANAAVGVVLAANPAAAAVPGIRDAITALPANQRQDAATRVAAVMNNPVAAAAINALAPGDKATALLAVASMPGTMDQKVAAVQMMSTNPAVLAAVKAAPTVGQRGDMLTVLASVPAAQQGAVAAKLAVNPMATTTLATIPAAARVEAMAIVANVVQNNPGANLAAVANAVSSPEGRTVLSTLTPAQQGTFAPLMANRDIAALVANTQVVGNPAATRDARVNILTLAQSVATIPGTAGRAQSMNLTALATALRSPEGRAMMAAVAALPADQRAAVATTIVAAVTAAPQGQRGAVMMAAMRTMGDANLRSTVMALPAVQQAGALLAIGGPSVLPATRTALAALPADARTAIVTAVAAAPANIQGVMLTNATTAMANPAVKTAILALPAGQQGAAMLAIGSPNVPAVTRNAFIAALNAAPADARVAMVAAVGGAAPAMRGTMMANAGRAMGDANIRGAIMALPADQRGAAMLVLGSNAITPAARTAFSAALAAAPEAARTTMVNAVVGAPPSMRATMMAAVGRAMGDAPVRDAILALPAAQQGAAILALGSPNIAAPARAAFVAALAAAPANARGAMINAVAAVPAAQRATMMGTVTRAMSDPNIRNAIVALPANRQLAAIVAFGSAAITPAQRTAFGTALAGTNAAGRGFILNAIAAAPAFQRGQIIAGIARLPANAQALVMNLGTSVPVPNANTLSRAIALVGQPRFATALAGVQPGLQNHVLTVATRLPNPLGAVQSLARVAQPQQRVAFDQQWARFLRT